MASSIMSCIHGSNKQKFSKRSTMYMSRLLNRRRDCFKSELCVPDIIIFMLFLNTGSPVCGNGVIERGEECDCRAGNSCPQTMQLCCNPKNCKIAPFEICRQVPINFIVYNLSIPA